MLERLIQSLIETAGADRRFEILVSVDDDDPAWFNQPPHAPWTAERPVTWYYGGRAATLGIKLNTMAKQSNGQILWFIANDMVMATYGWPDKFRAVVANLPNGMGVPFVHDDLHPDHASYPILTRQMIDAVGFMFPPWFPHWYIDTWWDQLGILLGVRGEIDVTVIAPEGRGQSHGLKDVTFWATLFCELLPFRSRDAMGLAKIAYGEISPKYAEVKEHLKKREAICDARTAHLITQAFAEVWEANAASPPGPGYDKVKAYAETMLANIRAAKPKQLRIAIAVPSTETWRATTANCIAALAAHSAMAGIDLFMCNVQTSQITHSRNTTVKLAMEANCDKIFWVDSDIKLNPDTLVRLLAFDKDIVGATYNKKTPRVDGTYETLGRLIDTHPDQLNDGLYEASLLPGGCLLVNMDVYKKLQWPWYGETYRWPGEDGLIAFKAMMSDYFTEVPSQEVLESLNATAFGAWIKDHYVVGDGSFPMQSEDLFWCVKARRANYKLWCSLQITGELAHLGTSEVTCRLPENTLRLVAAE